jgi:hemerythrin-like metal-binding protein
MCIQWSDKFATGVPEIDTQHRRLFDMVNDLEGRLRRNEAPARMMDILDSLARYASEHFSFEEDCMERCACPRAAVNKLAHQRFVHTVDSALREIKSKPAARDVFASLHKEVEDWLVDHICKIDTSLRACTQPGLSPSRQGPSPQARSRTSSTPGRGTACPVSWSRPRSCRTRSFRPTLGLVPRLPSREIPIDPTLPVGVRLSILIVGGGPGQSPHACNGRGRSPSRKSQPPCPYGGMMACSPSVFQGGMTSLREIPMH